MQRVNRSMLKFVFAGAVFCTFAINAVAGDPTGVWRGEWRSQGTGHHGPMRAVITPDDNGTYQARFTGRFAAVIPFAYRATLVPTVDAYGNSVLTSQKSLGRILGGYTMQANVYEPNFVGSFQAAGENGSVRMRRVR